MRRIVFPLLAVSLGLAGALALTEAALRLLGLGYGNAPLVSDPVLHHAHPRNYRFVSHDPAGEFGGFPVYYDAEGFVADPAGRVVYRPERHRRVVAVIGDSFVEGVQVPFEQGMVALLNGRAAPDVFFRNFGVSSYSPLLYNLFWERTVKASRPVHVVVLLFGNDIDDDARYLRWSRRDGSGAVVAVPGPGDGWAQRRLRSLYTVRALRRAQLVARWYLAGRPRKDLPAVGGFVEDTAAINVRTGAYIRALERRVRASGAGFTLTAIPSKVQSLRPGSIRPGGTFAEHAAAWAARNGIPFLDLTPAFRAYVAAHPGPDAAPFFPSDIHINAVGHRLVAAEIERRLTGFFTRTPGAAPD